jgi:hypothetical protein
MISALDRDLAELQEAAGGYAARHQRIANSATRRMSASRSISRSISIRCYCAVC